MKFCRLWGGCWGVSRQISRDSFDDLASFCVTVHDFCIGLLKGQEMIGGLKY